MRRPVSAIRYGGSPEIDFQLLLGHTRLENTVRYLGVEMDDALEIAEQAEA